ncbi:flagellar basal-body MS-ring/collar protein FliF [Bacillus fonticola]|uniref:flagellar basal-body MS-ring/collar protein FliF n=1 Tax=Bacillus fonticola TaxID=2728853 RepID=UPI0014758839|nr:flagellar basal-body MS-ring/collar protein FliF [Bacillus fonticola]
MNERIQQYVRPVRMFWTERTSKQRFLLIASILLLLSVLVTVLMFASRTTMAPLYSNLAPSETGRIKETLDSRGIVSEITNGGQTILVPEENIDTLMVELAAEGIPNSGNIDYSFFSQNAGIGTTDNEFNVMKLDATQSELANLIKGIDGVNDARVMISLPEESIFVSDQAGTASASIVLDTKPGYQFEPSQIRALYQLVSKSVPNLPTENIVIMDQYFEYYDLEEGNSLASGDVMGTQLEVKREIERDLQRQVQNMLGTLMGRDKVVVSVTTDLDFDQVQSTEDLVEPVNDEENAGIEISAQRITETFEGNGDAVGGIPQGEDPTDAGTSYLESQGGNGDYERVEETINSEVNRIRREIVEAPYQIRDLGIQVMVEPPEGEETLPEQRVQDIRNVLSSIVRTTIDKDAIGEAGVTEEFLEEKIAVSVQPFNGKIDLNTEPSTQIPWWIWLVGGIMLLAILLLIFLFMRQRRSNTEEEEESFVIEEMPNVPDVNGEKETESTVRRKQLEKLAKDRPDEFAKLLRTWLSEE